MDLILIESIVIFCAFLTVIRPFVKSFQDIEGTHFLSFFGSLLVVLIFAVYGLRPELVPLSIFVFVLFLTDIPGIIRIWRHLKYDDYGEGAIILRILVLVLLLGVSFVAIRYTPFSEQKSDFALLFAEKQLPTRSDIKVFVKEVSPTAPVVLVAPSVVGSAEGLTSFLTTLCSRGFTVVTFSQESVDLFPSFSGTLKERRHQGNLLEIGGAFLLGEHWSVANRLGKELVKKREEALKTLFPWVYHHYVLRQEGYELPFFGIAYDVSAEALENLLGKGEIRFPRQGPLMTEKMEVSEEEKNQGEIDFLLSSEERRKDSFLTALVLVEKTTFTSYVFETLDTQANNNKLQAFFKFFSCGFEKGIQKQKDLPVPVLFAVSDRITSEKVRHARYFFVEENMAQNLYPRLMVALEGAGIFDYSDIGQFYPLLELFFQGTGKRVITAGYYPETLGNLIGNFFVNFLVPPWIEGIQKVPVYGKTFVETNRWWKQPGKELIGIP